MIVAEHGYFMRCQAVEVLPPAVRLTFSTFNSFSLTVTIRSVLNPVTWFWNTLRSII